jgi:sigma-B regulation protein RsbQ
MNKNILERNNVKVTGQGQQYMIFAHGFGCDQNMWRFVTPSFEKDYRIVLFDYVGSGNSDLRAYNAQRYSNLNGYALDVIEICDALDVRDAIFVGHSVSSMIGLLAAIKRPEFFSDLILIGPSPCYINDRSYIGGFERKDIEELLETMEKNYIGWANFLAPAIMKNPDQPELSEELTNSFCSTDPKIARNFAMATFFSDNRKDLLAMKKPTLLMQCSEDIIAPLEVGDYLHAHLANSTLKVLKATGHCPHMSHPEETIEVMKEYLQNRSVAHE